MSGTGPGPLVEPTWLTDGTYELGYVDAIFSLLIEDPTRFYITPNEQAVFIYLIKRGLIRIVHDFTGMTDDEINHAIDILLSGED